MTKLWIFTASSPAPPSMSCASRGQSLTRNQVSRDCGFTAEITLRGVGVTEEQLLLRLEEEPVVVFVWDSELRNEPCDLEGE